MESPRATILPLELREARCSGTREPLGDVIGAPVLTMALSGETVELDAKSTMELRTQLAQRAAVSPADVCLLKDGELLTNDEHIYRGDEIKVLVTSASPPATNLPFEDFATPPPAPDMLGPCSFSFNGDPNDLVELLRGSNAEVQVNYQKCRLKVDYFDVAFQHVRPLMFPF